MTARVVLLVLVSDGSRRIGDRNGAVMSVRQQMKRGSKRNDKGSKMMRGREDERMGGRNGERVKVIDAIIYYMI